MAGVCQRERIGRPPRSCGGSPRSQEPSDSPGYLTHRKASTRRSPVFVVGGSPSARPAGLHQRLTPDPAGGPLPLRLVSITKWRPPRRREMARPYAIDARVVWKLATLSAKPFARSMPDSTKRADHPRGRKPVRIASVQVEIDARVGLHDPHRTREQLIAECHPVARDTAFGCLVNRVRLKHHDRRVLSDGTCNVAYPAQIGVAGRRTSR